MLLPSKPYLKSIFVFILALILLIPGYYGNTWHAVGKKWFVDWQKFHEHFVVARMVQSRQSGIFSFGALLGFGDVTSWDIDIEAIDHEYTLYANGGQFSTYLPYKSAPGLQAIPFSFIDQYSGLAPATILKLLRLFESTLTALVFALLLVWIASQFGLMATLTALAFLACSEWLTLFGANFYWNLWAFYLPLAVLLYCLQHSSPNKSISPRTLFILLAGTLLIKGLVNGFEYISAALVMPFTALVYYALRDKWLLKDFLHQFISAALGALAGTLLALVTLSLQTASVLGGWGQAFEFIAQTLGRRSFGDPAQYSAQEAESLRANLFSVLGTYLNGRALNLNSILHINLPGLEFSYWQIFSLFLIFTLFFMLRERFLGGFSHPQTARAFLAATWFSALAPLSWFVLFKAHSYIHTQINFILWQMPFTIFGFALCGYIISDLFQRNNKNKKMA